MEYMHKLFYNLGSNKTRESKMEERLSYDNVVLPNLQIKPMDQSKIYELYYIPTMTTINLINEISKKDIILENLYITLPPVAKEAFLIDLISSELQSTNEIEGVKSTKEEIALTTKEVLNKTNIEKNLRFKNIINSHIELIKDNLTLPRSMEDLRKIYDEVTKDSIDKDNLPDGSFFRTGDVYVKNKKGRIIHQGVAKFEDTENYIILTLGKLLTFLNNKDNYNPLIKNAIFHYYFGYIHPFYDGNGRINRFISSMYLKKDYSIFTALSLSQGSNKNRNIYLKAFDSTNQVSMQGELNFFVDSFLKVLNLGQNTLKENLENKISLLEESNSKIENDNRINSDLDLILISKLAAELYFFGTDDYIDVKFLEKHLKYGSTTIRKKLNQLTELGILTKISKSPIKCILNKNYLEN